MRSLVAVLVPVIAVVAAGCGPNCQSTCERLYFEDAANCGVPTPGRDTDEAFRDCINACEEALDAPGELGTYNPDDRQTSGESIILQNETQAAAWMECVDQTSCEDINAGYCEPH
jgi:hypothetical protein